MDFLPHDSLSDMEIQVDNEVRQSFTESGKWTRFISVTFFILAGLLLILVLAYSGELYYDLERLGRVFFGDGDMGAGAIIGFFLLMLVIYLFTTWLMFNFSRKIRSALASENSVDLNTGLNSLKLYFIITTVISGLLLVLTLYTLKSIL